MAQPRVYRDGMQCPRCGSSWLPKYGRSRGKQTYRCRQCLYHFIPDSKHPHQPERVKNLAVAMYAEGNSIEAIGRILEIKAGTVYSWVKKACQSRKLLQITGEQRKERSRGRALPKVISFDEMWSYVGARRQGKRRECWVWTAVVEEPDGCRWVDFKVGDRSEATFSRLYERLPEAERYRTDAYQVYGWLPANRNEVGKGGEVNRNEGLHSRLRDKLNRLHRRTKGYSKSIAMLSDSIALVCVTLNLI